MKGKAHKSKDLKFKSLIEMLVPRTGLAHDLKVLFQYTQNFKFLVGFAILSLIFVDLVLYFSRHLVSRLT